MAAHTPASRGSTGDVWSVAAVRFRGWRVGDQTAFDDLVRLLTPVLWQVVRAYGLPTATAEDVLQDTWLTLARDPGQVHDPEAVGGWLLTTARRRAWRAGRPGRERSSPDEDLEPSRPVAPAEDEALGRWTSRLLWDAVADLDARCRHLLRIVAFDDRPDYARIAEDLGMPVGSIGPTRRRCLDKLRHHLEGVDPHA